MYESFFQFEKPPFKVVPDPSMLFASRSVREAMSRLEFAVRTGKGITVMTGEVGTGKTTLVNRFLDKAGFDTQTAYIFNPTLSGLQLLKTLADELGVQTYGMAKVDLTRALYELLLRNRQGGRRTIVFVDEAQALSREALEELRLISNLETWQEKLLHIFLIGQPELLEMLESFNLRQLRQRVELFIQIEPMSTAETRQYIEHRIRVANPLREVVFQDPACQLIHRISGGIPRTINIICDASLLVAFVAETGSVTANLVREAARTIDAQQVSFRIGGAHRRPRFWQRLWGSAAALLAVLAVLPSIDTGRRQPAQAQPAAASLHTAGASAAVQREMSLAPGGAAAAPISDSRLSPASEPGPAPVAAGATPPSAALATPPAARAVPPPATDAVAAMVHLASYRGRAEAEEYAATLKPADGHAVYLQSVEVGGQSWHRVLLGDFANFTAARAYAGTAEHGGRYAYARAVQVPRQGLEPLVAQRR